MADGNPPEYDAMKDLAERCAKAETELERVKTEYGKVRSLCGDMLALLRANFLRGTITSTHPELFEKQLNHWLETCQKI